MSDVAAYHVLVCELFPVQEGSTYLPALETTLTLIHDMLPHHS